LSNLIVAEREALVLDDQTQQPVIVDGTLACHSDADPGAPADREHFRQLDSRNAAGEGAFDDWKKR
jgi:hypothetical protein